MNGANGTVYISINPGEIFALNEEGKELLGRFDIKGSPSGKAGVNPQIAVDQSNGHVISYDGEGTVHEYDAAGSFVAEFGGFTEGLTYGVAVDSACAIHEPPLDETTTPTCKTFDPANGTAYVAFDDPSTKHPPYDVTAFGPLDYPTPPRKMQTHSQKGGHRLRQSHQLPRRHRLRRDLLS